MKGGRHMPGDDDAEAERAAELAVERMRVEDERGLLGMLSRMKREGAILSYQVERSADARTLVVKLVPRAWVEHIDLSVGFYVTRKCSVCRAYVDERELDAELVCRGCRP